MQPSAAPLLAVQAPWPSLGNPLERAGGLRRWQDRLRLSLQPAFPIYALQNNPQQSFLARLVPTNVAQSLRYLLPSLSYSPNQLGLFGAAPFAGSTNRYRGDNSPEMIDRKSTRLNSSHRTISYAVFCLKK